MTTFLHAVEKGSLPSPAYSNSALALAKNEIAKRVSAGAIKTQKGKGKQRKFPHSEYMGHDAYAQRHGLGGRDRRRAKVRDSSTLYIVVGGNFSSKNYPK